MIFGGASFFFSLAETSLFSLSKWQVRQLAAESRGGRAVSRLLSEPQDLLATLALWNAIASAAMLATVLWMTLHGLWPAALSVGAAFFLILIGCEVVPKTLAVRYPEIWALRVARTMRFFGLISIPPRKVAQSLNTYLLKAAVPGTLAAQTALTDADYQELLEMAFQQGALAQSERDIILQIISLDRRTAREVMKPRSQMAAISDDLSIEEMIEAARRHRYRRLPIYDETPDTIVGILNTRALLLNPEIDLADAIEFPSFVPESMNLLQLLKSLQRQQRGLAIVLDEFGGTAGIVTMEDILGELVGHLRADVDRHAFLMEKLGPGRWRVSGTLRLDDFRREYPDLADLPEVETMGGLMMTLLDVVPPPGATAMYCGLRLKALVTDERRVKELLVEFSGRKTDSRS